MAKSFQDALRELINCHSMENGSATPDFMLAEYLCDCLATYEVIIEKCSPEMLAGLTGTSWTYVVRFGKKRAGRQLDGIEHNGFPQDLAA